MGGRSRETSRVYDEYYDTIWSLIEIAHEGITNEAYSLESFEAINEEACPDCNYQAMCPEYPAEEVKR